MAHYYAEIQGNRGEASRMGTKQSGISGHIRGWNVGAAIDISHIDGKDVVRVYRTTGSNGAGYDRKLIAEYSEGDPQTPLRDMSPVTYTLTQLRNGTGFPRGAKFVQVEMD